MRKNNQENAKGNFFCAIACAHSWSKIMQEMLDEEVCKICGRPAKMHSEPWNYMLQRLEEYKNSLKVDEDEEVKPYYQNEYIVELQKRDTILMIILPELPNFVIIYKR